MRIMRYRKGDEHGWGLASDRHLTPLPDLVDCSLAGLARRLLDGSLADPGPSQAPVPLSDVDLAPVPDPAANIYAVGLNYPARSDSVDVRKPDRPAFFMKPGGSVAVHGQDVCLPHAACPLDYEGELVLVIGRECKAEPPDVAGSAIAACTLANDLTDRSRKLPEELVLAKGCDGFAPIGPVLVPRSVLGDWQAQQIETRVNGQLRQRARLGDMLLSPEEIVSALSFGPTLRAGDLILTGSPPGSARTFDPPRFLRPGDEVTVGIGPDRRPVEQDRATRGAGMNICHAVGAGSTLRWHATLLNDGA